MVFFTGITNPPTQTFECKKLLSATKYADDVSLLVNKELEKGYLIDPFIKLPFDIYRVSPIGIVEGKYSGKKLLILDLSAPHTNNLHSSINDLINKEDYSLTYVKLDDAIKIVKSLGVKSSLSKCDVSDVFKNTPLNPETWHLLVFVLSVPFRLTTFDYPFGIFWSLYCLYLLDLRLLITPLVSFGLSIVCTF